MRKVLIIMAAVLCLAGCRVTYSFSGTSIDPDVHTICLPTFEYKAMRVNPSLSNELSEALRTRFRRMTSLEQVEMDGDRIAAVKAWNTNAYTHYRICGKLFLDCTGDGILRLSGAKFRRGRELPDEFHESYLHEGGDARTMGNSILLQLRKTDEDHPFVAPDWAYHFTDDDFDYATPKSTIPGVKFNYKRIQGQQFLVD